MDYRGPRSRKRLWEHWKWKLLAKVGGVRVGRRVDVEAIKEGDSRRFGDRMIAAGSKGKSQGSGSGLGFEHLDRCGWSSEGFGER